MVQPTIETQRRKFAGQLAVAQFNDPAGMSASGHKSGHDHFSL
jgi:hypothetical protein